MPFVRTSFWIATSNKRHFRLLSEAHGSRPNRTAKMSNREFATTGRQHSPNFALCDRLHGLWGG
jgi:hypothetical protein